MRTFIVGNDIPTTKLHNQFRSPAIDMAGGRGPCPKQLGPNELRNRSCKKEWRYEMKARLNTRAMINDLQS